MARRLHGVRVQPHAVFGPPVCVSRRYNRGEDGDVLDGSDLVVDVCDRYETRAVRAASPLIVQHRLKLRWVDTAAATRGEEHQLAPSRGRHVLRRVQRSVVFRRQGHDKAPRRLLHDEVIALRPSAGKHQVLREIGIDRRLKPEGGGDPDPRGLQRCARLAARAVRRTRVGIRAVHLDRE